MQNIDFKVLVAKIEKWVFEEESSDEDKGKDKCLMTYNEDLITNKESGCSSFKDDPAKAAKDANHLDWDSSSLYQVNKFITYPDNEKCMMFSYLCHHLSKVNEKNSLRVEIDTLVNDLTYIKMTLPLAKTKVTHLSFTKIDLP